VALGHFADLARSRTIEELKQEATSGIEDAPLFAMMGGVHYDAEGKITAENDGAPTEGEPGEDWYKTRIAHNLRFYRHVTVAGQIDPAREAITTNFPISETNFRAITTFSPFIPATHRRAFALGFARFLQGDFSPPRIYSSRNWRIQSATSFIRRAKIHRKSCRTCCRRIDHSPL
jgi:hypothetical protein